jgi:mannose-6-phosphate isomerase-like protein (cupin superfamily)
LQVERHRLSQVRSNTNAYLELLRTQDLSAGLYRLATGAVDTQQPHGEEEIYYVISGRARFSAGENDTAIEPGDLLFVPAREPHRFHDIQEDLELLVFFAPAEGSRRE